MSREVVNVTIANGASISGEASAGLAGDIVGVIMPTAWTAADITFEGRLLDGTTYGQIIGTDGNPIKLTGPAANTVASFLAGTEPRLPGFFKVRSGTTAVGVNQGGQRVLGVIIDRGGRA